MSNDLNHANDFRGVWIDVLTPIDKEFNIHEPLLKNHLRNLSGQSSEKIYHAASIFFILGKLRRG